MATLERAFPSSETVPLRRVVRRTTIIRIALAFALVGALALAFFAARDSDVRHAPLTLGDNRRRRARPVGERLRGGLRLDAAEDGAAGRARRPRRLLGLGVRGAAAGTPGRELLSFLRFFRPDPTSTTGSFPPNPWQDFRAGTRISAVSPRRTRLSSTPARRRARSSSSPTWRSCPTRWRGSAPSSLTFAATASRFASSRSTPVPRSGYSWRRSSARAPEGEGGGSARQGARAGEPAARSAVVVHARRRLVVMLLATNERLLGRLEVRR